MLVKICGLTDVKEVSYLQENNVDFAGMVLFFEKSKRNISIEKAKTIINAIHANCGESTKSDDRTGIKAVAVTVSPTKEQVDEIGKAGFDFIQIHGVVNDELISECKIPVLKAFNIDDMPKYEHYREFDNIKGFVFDAGQPGSGKPFDWNVLNELERDEDRLFILAGGLNDQNVRTAIEVVKPDGVDVSSGVELPDVILNDGSVKTGKDPEKIRAFVKNARI